MNATTEIVGAMFELNRVIRQRMTKAEFPGDLNMHQMHTLVIIHENPRITMSELAASLHISQASATPLVARLIRMKAVKRLTDRKNRKLVRLALTAHGKSMMQSALDFCQRELRSIFSLIPEDDQARFAATLKDLVSSVNASSSPHLL